MQVVRSCSCQPLQDSEALLAKRLPKGVMHVNDCAIEFVLIDIHSWSQQCCDELPAIESCFLILFLLHIWVERSWAVLRDVTFGCLGM